MGYTQDTSLEAIYVFAKEVISLLPANREAQHSIFGKQSVAPPNGKHVA